MAARYYIYRNLHKGNFSIRYRGSVHDRGDEFIATNVTFKVSEKGRQKVIEKKSKNVHAFCVTDKYYPHEQLALGLKKITYNPYIAPYFTCDGKQIEYATKVYFKDNKCYFIE